MLAAVAVVPVSRGFFNDGVVGVSIMSCVCKTEVVFGGEGIGGGCAQKLVCRVGAAPYSHWWRAVECWRQVTHTQCNSILSHLSQAVKTCPLLLLTTPISP